MKKKLILHLSTIFILFGIFMIILTSMTNDLIYINRKLNTKMPRNHEQLYKAYETSIDSSYSFYIYKVNDNYKLGYKEQFISYSYDTFDFYEYLELINNSKYLKIPEEYKFDLNHSYDWCLKRYHSGNRHCEAFMILDLNNHYLYTYYGKDQYDSHAFKKGGAI